MPYARHALLAFRIAFIQVVRPLSGVVAAVGLELVAAARFGPQQGEVPGRGVDHIHIGSFSVRSREVQSPAAIRIEEARDAHEIQQFAAAGFVSFDKRPDKVWSFGA